MSVQITKIDKISHPALRFIGKRYTAHDHLGEKWGKWWNHGWFSPLEALGCAPENGDAYCGAKRIVGGELEYWIGMFFPENTPVPDGYEFSDMPPLDYACFWLYGDGHTGELTSFQTHNLCLSELINRSLRRKEDDWCFEKYTCPRYTTPDALGKVILDYGIAVE